MNLYDVPPIAPVKVIFFAATEFMRMFSSEMSEKSEYTFSKSGRNVFHHSLRVESVFESDHVITDIDAGSDAETYAAEAVVFVSTVHVAGTKK